MMRRIKKMFLVSRDVRLMETERARVREAVVSYMKKMPARSVPAPRGSFMSMHLFVYRVLPLAAVFLLLGGTVSFAAEQALPDSPLYAIKISVNEPVRALFARTGEDQAQWEAERAERRLAETEALAVRGRLNIALQGMLERHFDGHAESVSERIKEFQDQGELEVAARLSSQMESALKAHERILQIIAGALATTTREDLAPLRIKVKAQKNGMIMLRMKFDDDFMAFSTSTITTTPTSTPPAGGPAPTSTPRLQVAAAGMKGAAQRKIDEVKKFIEERAGRVQDEVRSRAEARLRLAEDALAAGVSKFNASLYGDAFVLFQKSHRIAQEAKLLLSAGFQLHMEMRPEHGRMMDDDEEEINENTATSTPDGNDEDEGEGNDDRQGKNSGSDRGMMNSGRGMMGDEEDGS